MPFVALGGCESSGPENDGPGPTVQTIGPEGGEAASSDEVLTIIIPPGALTEPIEIEIQRSSDAPASLGFAYRVSPETQLAADATIIYNWFDVSVDGRDPNKLNIGRDIGAIWEALERVNIDFDVRTVTCLDPNLSFHYGLIEAASVPGESDTDTDTESDTDPSTGTESGPTSTDPTSESTTETSDPTTDTDSTTGDPTESSSSSGGVTGDPECGDGQPVPGEVCYIEGLTYASPAGPAAVLATDLDGDGNNDIVIAGSVGDEVSIRFGNGSGILFGETTYPVGQGPVALALADLDGGGDDLIVVNQDDAEVGVLIGGGDGTFGDHDAFAIGGTLPFALQIGDIDENTDLDVVTANAGTDDVSILLGEGDGTLTADQEVSMEGTPGGLALGDFNGNMHLDVLSIVGMDLVLAAGTGGSFGNPAQTDVGAATVSLLADDFNGDADLDAIVGDANNINVMFGSGVGTFGAGTPYGTGADPVALVAGDISGDGELDIVSVDAGDGTATVLVGNGAGSFDDAFTFSVGDNPSAVALADFNGDGVLDIAVTNLDDDDTTLLLSNP